MEAGRQPSQPNQPSVAAGSPASSTTSHRSSTSHHVAGLTAGPPSPFAPRSHHPRRTASGAGSFAQESSSGGRNGMTMNAIVPSNGSDVLVLDVMREQMHLQHESSSNRSNNVAETAQAFFRSFERLASASESIMAAVVDSNRSEQESLQYSDNRLIAETAQALSQDLARSFERLASASESIMAAVVDSNRSEQEYLYYPVSSPMAPSPHIRPRRFTSRQLNLSPVREDAARELFLVPAVINTTNQDPVLSLMAPSPLVRPRRPISRQLNLSPVHEGATGELFLARESAGGSDVPAAAGGGSDVATTQPLFGMGPSFSNADHVSAVAGAGGNRPPLPRTTPTSRSITRTNLAGPLAQVSSPLSSIGGGTTVASRSSLIARSPVLALQASRDVAMQGMESADKITQTVNQIIENRQILDLEILRTLNNHSANVREMHETHNNNLLMPTEGYERDGESIDLPPNEITEEFQQNEETASEDRPGGREFSNADRSGGPPSIFPAASGSAGEMKQPPPAPAPAPSRPSQPLEPGPTGSFVQATLGTGETPTPATSFNSTIPPPAPAPSPSLAPNPSGTKNPS